MNHFSFRTGDLYIHYSLDARPRTEDFSMHAHEGFELYWFIQGEAVFWVEGTPYPMHPGDLMLFNRSEAHKIEVSPDVPYERVAIHFTRVMIEEVLLDAFIKRPLGQGNRLSPIDFPDDFWKKCIERMIGCTADRRMQVMTYLPPLLGEIRTAFLKRESGASAQESLSSKILAYMNDHLTENLSPDSIAERFYISKSRLYALFKQATGSTVWQYITVKRLLLAKQMMQTGMSPTEACTRCGFRDYTVFFRAYKSQFGLSPRQDNVSRTAGEK